MPLFRLSYVLTCLRTYALTRYAPLLDSSNIGPKDWASLAAVVEACYLDYDGFVIVHGTYPTLSEVLQCTNHSARRSARRSARYAIARPTVRVIVIVRALVIVTVIVRALIHRRALLTDLITY